MRLKLGEKCWVCLHPTVSHSYYKGRIVWAGPDTAIVYVGSWTTLYHEASWEHIKNKQRRNLIKEMLKR